MEIEQSACINEKSDEEIAKENEGRKEKKRERNREYQRAWRQRKKDLKKKVLKEEKKEEKRKRHRENQRAYYQRTKGLKDNDKNIEELFQKKLDYLQMKIKKLDSNEDQENIVQCRASQNFENVQLEKNEFFTQQLRICEESHECITPKVILHRTTDIPGDGNCLFHSLIRVLQLQISTSDLRRQLRDSPYFNSCHNPQEAYNILSSNNEYGDLDCLYLFAKNYNQNICVHYHYFNVNSKNEDTRFCHFKANDTHNWIHLDLRELHFTPYLSDDEKKREDERKQKQKNKEYSKRYRDKKRTSKLLTGPSARVVLDAQPVINTSQIAGPSTGGVPYVPPVIRSSQNADLSIYLSRDVPSSLSIHSNYNSIEDKVRQRHFRSQIVESSPPHIHLQTYSAFQHNSSAHRQFENDFVENEFGHACDICDRLWFRKDLKYLQNNDATPKIEFIRTLLSNIAILKIKICSTCFTAIQKERIPPLSVYNGFKYPPLPDCLKDLSLDLVTERLISPRIPFMQIRRLRHVYGQYGIYGQVINFPIEVNTMVHQLPRQVDDDHAITVHIKRKTIHKSSYVYGIVTKRKIKVWLRYLKDTPLYKSYGVLVEDGFLNDRSYDVEDEIIFDEDGDNDILEQIPIEESLIAQQQTLMWNDDMYLRIASGEGDAPRSFLFDEHAEELSFPQIYLGQFREFRDAVTPFMMATSELRRSDRRGVTPQHLLYMAMKIMRIRIKDSLHISFKHVGQGIAITKEQIQSDDYIHGCIETNLAFLRSIPNSAYYWAERKRDLFAMIRQYGKPTVFFTISANEIGWPKLLQLLHNLKNNAKISVEEAADLHFIEKSTLINEDAVTCAIYFNKLVEIILKILQSKRHSPFKKYRILHYFKRIEFQHRGSPHAHILAWLDNAPEDALNRDYNEAIDLIDFLISVSAAEASGDIRLQTHKNTSTCYKGIASRRQQKCGFDAPFMPVKKTMILTPMPDTENGFQQYKAKYNSIQKNLEKYEYNGFQSFYDEHNIASDDEYVNIIRAGINRPQVFPKREPCEKWNNPFNPFIFNVVRSNTDFQFIPEEYSCAAYVAEYVNKTNRGVSNLQRHIIEIMDEHPEFNLYDITKNISINLLNHTEMTSQEAAWYLLREPLSKSSTVIVYIPTIWPVERHRIKKTMKELSELEDDSTDIWKENWFDKYEKRTEDLAGISLAQFVAKYYKNNKGDYVLREEPKVIRYRNYDMGTDYNEYRREMVTLHLPFRNEESEILAESRYLQLYEENEALILDRRKEFESNLDIEKTLEICRKLSREYVSDDGEEINDVVGRIPNENLFAELYHNPNAVLNDDLRLALFGKLGSIAKKTAGCTPGVPAEVKT
ncbi:unnamed protein product [Pieris macdunnoughi]|uniref:OTU domain-containing protein n=1 Tax=Pieris macdunnoughi TaxID=345717 RepID=A0A821VW52_9NEOP|nr:unnamed protein product [Pieris macdunnoughi]